MTPLSRGSSRFGADRRFSSIAACALFALFALAACGSRGERWDQALVYEGPVEIGGRLAWLDETLSSLIVVDPAGGGTRCIPAADTPRGLVGLGDDALVVGLRGGAPVLERIPPSANTPMDIPLPAAFDRIAVSPEGTRALVFHDASRPPRTGGPAARNLNELAVVQLDTERSTRIALQTGAVAPIGVRFSDDGGLAAVLFDRAVALVDMREPFPRVTVPLKLPSGEPLRLQEALLAPDGSRLFVRASGADDVIAISIDRVEGALGASINFLGPEGGGTLRAIALPAGSAGAVAALYDGRAVLLDAGGDTSKERSVALDGAPTRISALGDGLLLLHGDVGQGAASAYAAAWDPASARLAQDRLAGRLTAPPRIAAGIAYFAHAAAEATGALTAVTAEADEIRLRLRLRPVGLDGVPVATAIDPADGTLFVGLEVPRKGSGAAPLPDDDFSGTTGALVSVRGPDLSIGGFTLDLPIVGLGIVGEHLFALLVDDLGGVTFVPKSDLRRSAASTIDGVLATGMMGCSP